MSSGLNTDVLITADTIAVGGILMPGMIDTHRHRWQTAGGSGGYGGYVGYVGYGGYGG